MRGAVRWPRSASERAFSRRQWSRRWGTWRGVLALLALLGAVAAAAWAVFFSALLAVADVEVQGERTLRADRVARTAEVRLGEPLARVDVGAVAARVRRLPPVRQAEVSRAWPDTVLVRIDERVPVAVVERDGRHRLVDVEGVQFRQVAGPRRGMPTIRAAARRAAAEAAEVVAALPRDVLRRVDWVDATTMDSITLHLAAGRRVLWGSADDSARKAEVLAVLVKRRGGLINVSVPSAPTVRL